MIFTILNFYEYFQSCFMFYQRINNNNDIWEP